MTAGTPLLGAVLAMVAVCPLVAQTAISADGVVESTSGGFRFPDGTVQASAAVTGSALVEDTGLDASQCFDDTGTSRPCGGTGEDGETQPGVTWPTPRFTDNGNGTITDQLTGLIWLEDANCAGVSGWQAALNWVGSFNTTAVTCTNYTALSFADWRVPSIKELLSLVDYGQTGPALPPGHPFLSIQSQYWSSSSDVASTHSAWTANVDLGTGQTLTKGSFSYTWPVRGGQ